MDFSIVIPAYNEQERLGQTLVKICSYLKELNIPAEIIVVDDGSRDETAEIAGKTLSEFSGIESRVIRYEQNRGKGYAVRLGLMRAKGEIGIFSDADLSTPISEMFKLVEPIQKGECDVAFGSRAIDRNLIGNHQSWRREQSGKIFNLIVRTMTGLPFADTQCGFKAFRLESFQPLLELMKVERFGFDVEFLFVAAYHQLKLKEIGVCWDHCEGTKVSFWRDSRKMFSEVYQIRRNKKKGLYDNMSPVRALTASETVS